MSPFVRSRALTRKGTRFRTTSARDAVRLKTVLDLGRAFVSDSGACFDGRGIAGRTLERATPAIAARGVLIVRALPA
jgi:hypothetical protein